jgi:hypothetical protein
LIELSVVVDIRFVKKFNDFVNIVVVFNTRFLISDVDAIMMFVYFPHPDPPEEELKTGN